MLKRTIIPLLVFIIIALALVWSVEKTSLTGRSPLSAIAQEHNDIQKKAQLTTLNFFIPDFSRLIAYLNNNTSLDKGDWVQLKNYYQRVNVALPQLSEAYIMLGLCAYHLNDTAAAVSYYQKALDLNPGSVFAYYDLGLILYKNNLYDQAFKVFSLGLHTDPQENLKFLLNSHLFQQIYLSSHPNNTELIQGLTNNLQQTYQNMNQLSLLSCYQLKQCKTPPANAPDVNAMSLKIF